MFIGHFAVGFAGKRAAPAVSLGLLFLAAQFLDLLWPSFVLFDLETVKLAPGITAVTPLDFTSYPYSHSLLAAVGWSVLVGLGYWLIRRDKRGSVVLGALVFSHFVLDFVTHRPDLQLSPGSPVRVGLGLWFSLPATVTIESLMFLAGVLIYRRCTKPRNRAGKYGFLVLVLFLFVAYLAAIFGPPPPNTTSVALGGQMVWLLVLWGFWVDRHRSGRMKDEGRERSE
jgi:hypothetical protein